MVEPIVCVTWNIHHGRGEDGVVDLDRIAAVLRQIDADVIALQEVDVGVRRSGRTDQAAELGRRLGMESSFGRNLELQGGHYGNAILTRHPVESSENHLLPCSAGGEQRGVLAARVTTRAGPLTVLCTHLDHRPGDGDRLRGVGAIQELIDACADPVVLLGDFNARPGSAVHHLVTDDLVDAWEAAGRSDGASYPSDRPRRRIDWVLLTGGRGLRALDAAVVETTASDHRPVRVLIRQRLDRSMASPSATAADQPPAGGAIGSSRTGQTLSSAVKVTGS